MDIQVPGAERRKFERSSVNFSVYYRVNLPIVIRMRIGGKEFGALATDISEGGMALLMLQEAPGVEAVTVKFALVNETAVSFETQLRSIEVMAKVCYKLFVHEKNAYRLGLEFLNLSDTDRQFIKQFTASRI